MLSSINKKNYLFIYFIRRTRCLSSINKQMNGLAPNPSNPWAVAQPTGYSLMLEWGCECVWAGSKGGLPPHTPPSNPPIKHPLGPGKIFNDFEGHTANAPREFGQLHPMMSPIARFIFFYFFYFAPQFVSPPRH